ncbi:MAG: histidine kinase [Sphingomonadales bacterium]|nr:histidine kinase [Sphingomonadales bacterium]
MNSDRGQEVDVTEYICHVLIIEDEWLIAELIRHHLETLGATSIDYAMTQTEPVALAIAHKPEVITSGVKLIEGTRPLAVRAIHEEVGPIPIIYITATPDDCSSCEHSIATLSKPVTYGALADAIAIARTAL